MEQTEEFFRKLQEKMPFLLESEILGRKKISVSIAPDNIRKTVGLLKELLPEIYGEMLTVVDLLNDVYGLVYYFWSYPQGMLVKINTKVEGENPSIESISDLFPSMEWHEREMHEMFGVNFEGHPNLDLLLLPEELRDKYPLKKSFDIRTTRIEEVKSLRMRAKTGRLQEGVREY